MPRGGADARARQCAAVYGLAHEQAVAPALGKLLDALAHYGERLPRDSDDASLIRVARRDFQKMIKIPPDHVTRANAHGSASYNTWTRARPANDFAAMVPYLERTLDLSREYSSYFAPYKHVADPHIDDADEGMTTASIRKLFSELKSQLVPMVGAICEQPVADDSSLRQACPKAAQFEFALNLAQRLGYDFNRGRLDLTHHPFSTRFSSGDVRITSHVSENNLGDVLFSTLHEAGHAMYEQGVSATLDGTPLGKGVSAGIHESQSRLWENVIGRSRDFWEHFYPSLQRVFPEQLGSVPITVFHRAINKVARSIIRTDADEVTYNLHVMLRFDLRSRRQPSSSRRKIGNTRLVNLTTPARTGSRRLPRTIDAHRTSDRPKVACTSARTTKLLSNCSACAARAFARTVFRARRRQCEWLKRFKRIALFARRCNRSTSG